MAKKKTAKKPAKKKPTPRVKVHKPEEDDPQADEPIEPIDPLPNVDNSLVLNALRMDGGGLTLNRVTTIAEFLGDRDSLIKVAESAALGGTPATIEMQLGFPPGMLVQWLANGKADANTSDARDSLYAVFYQFYLAATSEARLLAEASLLRKNPSVWLDRCDPLKQLESLVPDGQNPTVQGSASQSNQSDDKPGSTLGTVDVDPETNVGFRVFGNQDSKPKPSKD